ncbi:MAG: hypothetical protein U9N10_10095 [Bacillota bacterium]|nr:hypothetical protein [Bacillota bacterium]
MKNLDLIIKNRKENSETLCWCLGFNNESELKVKKYVDDHGTRNFLLNYKSLNFTNENMKRIKVLKRVIEKYNGDIETIDFDGEGDF